MLEEKNQITSMTKLDEKEEEKKDTDHFVDPPFSALPSFHSAAIILSYFRYAEDVKVFLIRLSKRSSRYYAKH